MLSHVVVFLVVVRSLFLGRQSGCVECEIMHHLFAWQSCAECRINYLHGSAVGSTVLILNKAMRGVRTSQLC